MVFQNQYSYRRGVVPRQRAKKSLACSGLLRGLWHKYEGNVFVVSLPNITALDHSVTTYTSCSIEFNPHSGARKTRINDCFPSYQ